MSFTEPYLQVHMLTFQTPIHQGLYIDITLESGIEKEEMKPFTHLLILYLSQLKELVLGLGYAFSDKCFKSGTSAKAELQVRQNSVKFTPMELLPHFPQLPTERPSSPDKQPKLLSKTSFRTPFRHICSSNKQIHN